jgi:hypothetical protein
MFMWMLHEVIWKISTRGKVYVNVTWDCSKDVNSGKCLCKCYMALFKIYLVGKMFYVNVTWDCLKYMDSGKCLCECYMSLFERYQKWKMFM